MKFKYENISDVENEYLNGSELKDSKDFEKAFKKLHEVQSGIQKDTEIMVFFLTDGDVSVIPQGVHDVCMDIKLKRNEKF